MLAAGSDKRLVIVLNKIDLVPREVVQKWLVHLRNEFPTIAFKSSTQESATKLQQREGEALGGRQSGASGCFGAQSLISLLGNFCRNRGMRTTIRVGVIGYPNVGKSSLINSLKRGRVCGVAASAGFTKACQEISLDKYVKLIDSPGTLSLLRVVVNVSVCVMWLCSCSLCFFVYILLIFLILILFFFLISSFSPLLHYYYYYYYYYYCYYNYCYYYYYYYYYYFDDDDDDDYDYLFSSYPPHRPPPPSAGIVFGDKTHSASDLVLRNCVKLEDLEDPVPAVHGVLTRCEPESIMEMYTVPA